MSRRLMLRKDEDVRLWFSSNDAPVVDGSNSYLVERVQQIPFLIHGSNVYDSSAKLYNFSANSQYADSSDTTVYDFGNHWRLNIDVDAQVYADGATPNGPFFLDFGSVGRAPHAFGFKLKLMESSTIVGINWKLKSTSALSTISTLEHPYVPSVNAGEYERVRGYYAIVDGGDGYDRLVVSINGVTEQYEAQIPQVSYEPPWNSARFAVGGALSTSYSLPIYMREIKMVAID